MKWRTARERTNERKRHCFAWFPVALDSGDTIWLESYVRDERWNSGYGDGYWETLCCYQERPPPLKVRNPFEGFQYLNDLVHRRTELPPGAKR